MEKFMNIKKNNLFKKDFNYPLFSRARIKSDTTFFFVLERRTFLFKNKRQNKFCHTLPHGKVFLLLRPCNQTSPQA